MMCDLGWNICMCVFPLKENVGIIWCGALHHSVDSLPVSDPDLDQAPLLTCFRSRSRSSPALDLGLLPALCNGVLEGLGHVLVARVEVAALKERAGCVLPALEGGVCAPLFDR